MVVTDLHGEPIEAELGHPAIVHAPSTFCQRAGVAIV